MWREGCSVEERDGVEGRGMVWKGGVQCGRERWCGREGYGVEERGWRKGRGEGKVWRVKGKGSYEHFVAVSLYHNDSNICTCVS